MIKIRVVILMGLALALLVACSDNATGPVCWDPLATIDSLRASNTALEAKIDSLKAESHRWRQIAARRADLLHCLSNWIQCQHPGEEVPCHGGI